VIQIQQRIVSFFYPISLNYIFFCILQKGGKKGKKKKLSKREMEIAKIQNAKEEKERLIREAEEMAAREKKLAIETALRTTQLVKSAAILDSYDKFVLDRFSQNKKLQEVCKYMTTIRKS